MVKFLCYICVLQEILVHGKTTVARFIGKIFEKYEILPEGDKFVEVQRSDLVGEYIGKTAPKTKRLVDSADGGILFIDEAYSLGSGFKDDDYGKECISTLLKEMEDKRNTLCVILAGYTKEMEVLLKTNPGFDSRIQFKINFPNYTLEELYEIFKLMAKNENYKIEEDFETSLENYLKVELKKEDFSNARCIRNLFEKTKIEQAYRIMNSENENINLLKRCDIENAVIETKKKQKGKIKIGF